MAYLDKKKASQNAPGTTGASAAAGGGNPYEPLVSGSPSKGVMGAHVNTGQADQGTLAGGNAGASATGYVNFDRIYNANAGVAGREAGKRQAGIDAQAKAAQTELTGAQGNFNKAVTGATTNVPTQSQRDWASYGSTGVTPGKRVMGAYVNAGQTDPSKSFISEQQEGLDGGPGIVRDANGNPVVDSGGRNVMQDTTPSYTGNAAADEAAVRAGAGAKYTGPNALSEDTDAYTKLLGDATSAQDSAKNPLVGLGQTDAALLGAAGRSGFEQRKSRYSGLKDQVSRANDASIGQADAARNITTGASQMYDDLLHQHEGRVGDAQAEESAAQAVSDKKVADAQKHADNKKAYDEAMHGGSGMDHFRNTVHDFAKGMNPVDWIADAAHVTSPTQAGTDYFGRAFAGEKSNQFNQGNVSRAWGPDDADVFAAMTPADWEQFNSMSVEDQKAWIAAHKKKKGSG